MNKKQVHHENKNKLPILYAERAVGQGVLVRVGRNYFIKVGGGAIVKSEKLLRFGVVGCQDTLLKES